MADRDLGLVVDVRASVGTLILSVALTVAPGETVAVVGPNGAGKTTLLRVLAGLLPADEGSVRLAGQQLDNTSDRVHVPPDRRPIGVVFQDYLLFPHLRLWQNVAFGLRARGMARGAARTTALVWLDRVGLRDRADARPSDLSGGQAQRVALARALATDPAMLLLDEPLSALDVSTRAAVRHELRQHLDTFAGVRVVVTHDPIEAATLADRLVVLEAGSVVQTGSLRELAEAPRSAYVADLVGTNLFRATSDGTRLALRGGGELVVARGPVGEVFASVHPRTVALYATRPAGTPRNVWPATVRAIEPAGDAVRVRVDGAPAIVAHVTRGAVEALGLAPGTPVWVGLKASEIDVYAA
jgi:molybdate transport system ATP-binding protein